MYLILIRSHICMQTVHGQLYMVDPQHAFDDSICLQQRFLHYLCDTIENNDFLIPELIYPVSVTQSPRFHRLLPLLSMVPERSGIRIHAGNTCNDSQGCILVGQPDPFHTTRLLSSLNTEQQITNLILSAQSSHETTRLEINHLSPPFPDYHDTDYSHHYALPAAHRLQDFADNANE